MAVETASALHEIHIYNDNLHLNLYIEFILHVLHHSQSIAPDVCGKKKCGAYMIFVSN
jgi:hypothetical protein